MAMFLVLRKNQELTDSWSLAVRVAVKQVDRGKGHQRILSAPRISDVSVAVSRQYSCERTEVVTNSR